MFTNVCYIVILPTFVIFYQRSTVSVQITIILKILIYENGKNQITADKILVDFVLGLLHFSAIPYPVTEKI